MKLSKLRVGPAAAELAEGFRRIRRTMGVPENFPPEVEAEAVRVAAREVAPGPRRTDYRDIEFLTIDPPASMDLDQAFAGAHAGDGYRVHYAIADLGHFIDPGSALEGESLKRGSTLYSPDGRAPLYPTALSEDAASLLPNSDRPAVVWSFEIDDRGDVRRVHVERAIIRSRRRISYAEAQQEIDAGTAAESLEVMQHVGSLRQQLERERGGIDLRIADQQIEKTPNGFQVTYRTDFPVERWNAQISLMTGIAAAGLMLRRGAGLLRTLPAPSEETIAGLRSSAAALDIPWPQGESYQEFIRRQDPSQPRGAAILTAARVLFRGAGYSFFFGEAPAQANHYAVAAPYAHVTAPLRRMADRLCNELLLLDGEGPPGWLLARLEGAPEIMKQADKRSRELESRMVDFVEARMLSSRVGEVFEGVVVQCNSKDALIQLRSPAVLANSAGSKLRLGDRVSVRLLSADPDKAEVRFEQA